MHLSDPFLFRLNRVCQAPYKSGLAAVLELLRAALIVFVAQ
jgi:hypothetical protein